MGGGLRAATEVSRLDVDGRLPFGRERTVDHKGPIAQQIADIQQADPAIDSWAAERAADEDAERRKREGGMFQPGGPRA